MTQSTAEKCAESRNSEDFAGRKRGQTCSQLNHASALEMVVGTVVDSRGNGRRCIQQAFNLRLVQGPLPARDLCELNGYNWRARSYVSPHAVGLECIAAKKMFPADAFPPLQSATQERCRRTRCRNARTPVTATEPLLLLMTGGGNMAFFLHWRQCVCPAPQSVCQCAHRSAATDMVGKTE